MTGIFAYGDKRPLYVIHPDVDSKDDIEESLKTGANTLYTYVNFDDNGNPTSTGRGWLSKQKFEAFLVHLRKRIMPGEYFHSELIRISELISFFFDDPSDEKKYNERFVLQIFEIDLKGHLWRAKVHAAKKMGEYLMFHILDEKTRGFNIVIMLNNPGDMIFVENFYQLHLARIAEWNDRIGWGYINGDTFKNVELLKKFSPNIWQEVMNSGPDFLFPHANLSVALLNRNRGVVKKVITGIEIFESTLEARLM